MVSQRSEPLIDASTNTGYATLLDALSVALDYPKEEVIDAWRSGEFLRVVDRALQQSNAASGLHVQRAALDAGFRNYLQDDLQTEDVQADYVALFEHGREQPPVRLYQHLYAAQSHLTQLELYRRLTQLYRDHGITLKQGEGAQPPDQLSVQVEFLAYLCGRLAGVLAPDEAAPLQAAMLNFARMLYWIDAPIERLSQTHPHPLYLPLLRFLRALLELRTASEL